MEDNNLPKYSLTSDQKNFLTFFDSTLSGMALVDNQLNVVKINKYMHLLFGVPEGNFNDGHLGDVLRCLHAQGDPLGCGSVPECKDCCINLELHAAIQSGSTVDSKEAKLFFEQDGKSVSMWVLYALKPIWLDGSRFVLLSIMDITKRKNAETAIRTQSEYYRALVENLPDVIVRYDVSGRRLYVNPAYERLAGADTVQLLGKTPVENPVFGHYIGDQIREAIEYVVANRTMKEIETVWQTESNPAPRLHLSRLVPEYGENNEVISILCLSHDRTELRKYEDDLLQMAFYDQLTGLPNRVLFNDRLEQLIKETSRGNHSITGIMYLDMDGFKVVNDTLGHSAGDELIQAFGERIRECLRDHDTVARLGGDEFAVILTEVRNEVDLATIAKKIQTVTEVPFTVLDKQLFMTTSIGISCYPSDSKTPYELLQFADVAMYHAKMNGKNRFHFYSPILTLYATQRMELANDLRTALQNNELELYYQPKVDTLIGQLVGAEALIRWNHPVRGKISPDEFISIAEDTGIISSLGTWALLSACRTAVEWNRDMHYPISIAVNISGRQFMSGDLVETVRTILVDTSCSPEWLELEITENILMNSVPETITTLEALSAMGITLAIDDFGTGYSALSYLIDFPIDVIKIDKKFIDEITTQKRSSNLVKTFVTLGNSLGIELVAEGAETIEQVAMLDMLGCHVIQGYFYGKPMPLSEFNSWMTGFYKKTGSASKEVSKRISSSWRDYLTTGNAMIDSQHREIFERVTKLSELCRAGKGHTQIVEMLDYMAEYVKTHFTAEENLLFAVNAPNYVEHKAAHDNFTNAVNSLISKYKAEGESNSLIVEVNYVAVNWLTKHICTLDRELAERVHLSESGSALLEKDNTAFN